MADRQVTCATKPNGATSNEAITKLGGPAREGVYYELVGGIHTYYTFVGGRRADLKPRQNNGTVYVQTAADGYWNNNLLALPNCP